MSRRALEIGTAVAGAQVEGLPVAFMTFTMRHHRGQRLDHLWDALAKGWGRITSGVRWKVDRADFGVVGYVRVVEVTHGRNGWHVHVHCLVFGTGITRANLDVLGSSMWGRWSRGLVAAGLDAPLPIASEWHVIGGDLDGTALGEYLAKGLDAAGSLGMELTATQSKVARAAHSTSSVWDLLEAGPVLGDRAALEAWWEYEQGSKGRRQIAWSRGLRERFGIGVELSDDEVAAEAVGTEADTLVWITRPGWARLVSKPWLLPKVLDRAETGGAAGLSSWLTEHGVDHERVFS